MKPRMLVIDDSGFEDVVAEALAHTSFETHEMMVARSLYEGAQALWQLCWMRRDQRPPVIVLTTRFTNGSNGYRLLEFIQAHPQLQPLCTIMCSAEATRTDRYFARKRGALYLDRSAGAAAVARLLTWAVPPQSVQVRHSAGTRR